MALKIILVALGNLNVVIADIFVENYGELPAFNSTGTRISAGQYGAHRAKNPQKYFCSVRPSALFCKYLERNAYDKAKHSF